MKLAEIRFKPECRLPEFRLATVLTLEGGYDLSFEGGAVRIVCRDDGRVRVIALGNLISSTPLDEPPKAAKKAA
jgi:hypothetical protein